MMLATTDTLVKKPWVTSTSVLALEILSNRANASSRKESVEQTSRFIQELYRRDLLSPEEERLLFKWLSELKQHASVIQEIPDDLRCEQTSRDLYEIEQAVLSVRNHLVESNLRLVVAAAKKFHGPNEIEFQDLICEGNAILMKAVDLFKVEFGYRFSTYAMTALHRGFYNHVQREYKRSNRFRCSEFDYLERFEDQSITEHSLESEHNVSGLLEEVDDRERDIIKSRFGLVAGEKPLTFRELGVRHNLSKERIRQIANQALTKLRDKLEAK